MDEIVVSTVVYLPPDEVYEFLIDFPRYAKYSKHLTEVTQDGDGTPGTEYGLHLAWWKLTYTARSRVTEVEPPTRIDWRIVKDIDAHGRWRVAELDQLPADAPDDAETGSRVFLEVVFDPHSADEGALDLPRFVSFDWVLKKVKPVVVKEAERVVRRIVRDLEGRDREVHLELREEPDSV
ncbi:SRPBCC family protein [Halobium salinum]|uniref:SRPBCC family protein n=1 Tax=Halobium salinum TaxID=1364940 RepID=A0ABD5P7V6_9EURY|nr:SRPBCC family protein [Halobium salinum]